MAKILFLEDDKGLAEAVVDHLNLQHHTIEWLISGKEALDRLQLYSYDLAILDLTVKDMDGIAVCERYRANGGTIPILMLTGRTSIPERVSGFEAGADDYLPKPFAVEELLVRIKALLRRPKERVDDKLQVGELTLDLNSRVARKGPEILNLMPKEYVLLEFLMRSPNRVFTGQDLLEKLWSSESDSTELAVRKCLTRLRNKIDGTSENGYIVTVRGLGYKLCKPDVDKPVASS